VLTKHLLDRSNSVLGAVRACIEQDRTERQPPGSTLILPVIWLHLQGTGNSPAYGCSYDSLDSLVKFPQRLRLTRSADHPRSTYLQLCHLARYLCNRHCGAMFTGYVTNAINAETGAPKQSVACCSVRPTRCQVMFRVLAYLQILIASFHRSAQRNTRRHSPQCRPPSSRTPAPASRVDLWPSVWMRSSDCCVCCTD
jgi:hypothetical protein